MHKLSLWKVLARKAKHVVHVINKGDILHTWQERPLEMMTHKQRTRSWERHRLKRDLQAEGLEVRNQVSRKLMKGLLAASQWVWKEGCEERPKGRWRGKEEGPCRVWFKQMSSPFERCTKGCFSRSWKAGILFPDVIDPQYWFLIGPWASTLYFQLYSTVLQSRCKRSCQDKCHKNYSYACVPHTALDNQGASKEINHMAFLLKRS